MRKGKRFQKKYDVYITHDRSKFSGRFVQQLQNSIRQTAPNIRYVDAAKFDIKKDEDEKKKVDAKSAKAAKSKK